MIIQAVSPIQPVSSSIARYPLSTNPVENLPWMEMTDAFDNHEGVASFEKNPMLLENRIDMKLIISNGISKKRSANNDKASVCGLLD